jgi:hypothetical protein
MQKLINALRAYNVSPYKHKSTHPSINAQENLTGRTHYADPQTLKFFKARIMDGTRSANGLYYLLQESVIHPEFGRARRNVVFNVFGAVVAGREALHKTAKSANKEYEHLVAWMDAHESDVAVTLRERIAADMHYLAEALRILDDGSGIATMADAAREVC